MELQRLLTALAEPGAYPHSAAALEVRHTHISAVFLAGDHVYKVKKPLDLGFLDFTTLERRRHFCCEEVRLNRRLAPSVYLGVVPIVARGDGVRVGGEGEPVEWAVHMRRLPDDATLEQRLGRDEVTPAILEILARRLAAFHRDAAAGDRISRFGSWEVVARNARENFEQTAVHRGTVVSVEVHRRARALTEEALVTHRELVDGRARAGIPRDTHGDLHLDHVYLFPDREPPDDLIVVDCIEFNERFRYADPVADLAFLTMDLAFHGHRDLASTLAEHYFRFAQDAPGGELLPLYASYRAAVRAKVRGLEFFEGEVPQAERERALVSARGHWLLALGTLEEPARRPCLICVGGLPGTGKTTLARGLAERAHFAVISSDRVRKELAGLSPEEGRPAGYGEGLYTEAWNERTYAECLQRVEGVLFRGGRALVDANFRRQEQRAAFRDAADRWGVPGLFLLCEVAPEEARKRLDGREGGASDADWEIYRRAAEAWEAPAAGRRSWERRISCSGPPEQVLRAALAHLRKEALS